MICVESYVSTTDYANTGMYELGAIPLEQLTNYQAGVTVKTSESIRSPGSS